MTTAAATTSKNKVEPSSRTMSSQVMPAETFVVVVIAVVVVVVVAVVVVIAVVVVVVAVVDIAVAVFVFHLYLQAWDPSVALKR